MGKNKAAVANQQGTRGKNNKAAVAGDRGGGSNSVNNNKGGGGAGGATYGTNKMCWDIRADQSYHINNTWTPGGLVGLTLDDNKNIYFPTPTDDPKVYPNLPYSFGNPVVFSDSDIDPKSFN
ncbi:hypothetical protein ACP275_08G071200 [Erythranthe tilingii]